MPFTGPECKKLTLSGDYSGRRQNEPTAGRNLLMPGMIACRFGGRQSLGLDEAPGSHPLISFRTISPSFMKSSRSVGLQK